MLLLVFITWSTLCINSGIWAKRLQTLPLPEYITRACLRDDPKINECVVEVGAPAIKFVSKGDPKYRIPSLDPLEITELRIKQGSKQVGLEMVYTDCKMYGLKDTVFTKSNLDIKKHHNQWDFTLDQMKLVGKYNVSGQVLLLPITGHGDSEITFDKLTFSFIFDYLLEKKSNGYTYVKITNSSMPFESGHISIKLDSLFNGDKLLGDNMNQFLNENWKEILKDIKPSMSEAMAQVATSVLSNMAQVVPFDFMFPEKK